MSSNHDAQRKRVLAVVWAGGWWTLERIHREILRRFGIRDPEASISSRLRDLRKRKHGRHIVLVVKLPNSHLRRYRVVLREAVGI